jgi:hypothetical protein
MYKQQFKSLLKSIGQMPLETACPLQLATICFGYSHLLMLSYTAPELTSEFGKEAQAEAIIDRMDDLIDRLAAFLDQEMSPENRASAILCLLESLSFQHNPAAMEVAFNAMEEYLQPQEGSAAEVATQPPLEGSSAESGEQTLQSIGAETGEQPQGSSATMNYADRCKILCYHYYFTSEENSRRQAESILDGWISELSTESNRPAGQTAESHRAAIASKESVRSAGNDAEVFWNLPLGKALERLETLVMYSYMVDAQRYDNHIHGILEHYARDPQTARKVRFLSIVDEAGYYKQYHGLMEQIIEHAMQGDLSLDKDTTRQCREQDLLQAIRFYILAIYFQHRSQRT